MKVIQSKLKNAGSSTGEWLVLDGQGEFYANEAETVTIVMLASITEPAGGRAASTWFGGVNENGNENIPSQTLVSTTDRLSYTLGRFGSVKLDGAVLKSATEPVLPHGEWHVYEITGEIPKAQTNAAGTTIYGKWVKATIGAGYNGNGSVSMDVAGKIYCFVNATRAEIDAAVKTLMNLREVARGKSTGLLLDIARHFYTPDEIKAFASYLKEAGGSYLHLHLSDNQNYAIESAILGQISSEQNKGSNGIYTNPTTGKKFLSAAQMADIAAHCASIGLGFVPELDTPGHAGGIYKLYVANQEVQAVFPNVFTTASGQTNQDQLSFTNSQDDTSVTNSTRYFVRALIDEMLANFGGVTKVKGVHLGGDEFAGSSNVDWAFEHINYFNWLAAPLLAKGYEVAVWNDGLVKPSFSGLNKDIVVNYWRWYNDQDVVSGDDVALKANRVTPSELTAAGYRVRLSNSYYTYSVPTPSRMVADVEYAANDVTQNWDLTVWDSNRGNPLTSTTDIVGSLVAIWGENLADDTSGTDVLNAEKPLIAAVIGKTN